MTLSAWVNTSSTAYMGIIDHEGGGTPFYGYYMYLSSGYLYANFAYNVRGLVG
jgi:hypothetical protein